MTPIVAVGIVNPRGKNEALTCTNCYPLWMIFEDVLDNVVLNFAKDTGFCVIRFDGHLNFLFIYLTFMKHGLISGLLNLIFIPILKVMIPDWVRFEDPTAKNPDISPGLESNRVPTIETDIPAIRSSISKSFPEFKSLKDVS